MVAYGLWVHYPLNNLRLLRLLLLLALLWIHSHDRVERIYIVITGFLRLSVIIYRVQHLVLVEHPRLPLAGHSQVDLVLLLPVVLKL